MLMVLVIKICWIKKRKVFNIDPNQDVNDSPDIPEIRRYDGDHSIDNNI